MKSFASNPVCVSFMIWLLFFLAFLNGTSISKLRNLEVSPIAVMFPCDSYSKLANSTKYNLAIKQVEFTLLM